MSPILTLISVGLVFGATLWMCGACDYHHLHNNFDVQPPPDDQCKFVNATEPPQCPMTIGPPCPPCFTNIAADYSQGYNITFNESEKQSMISLIEYYTNWWNDNYPPTKTSDGFDIYGGSAGRSQIFLRLFRYSNNHTLLTIAQQYIDHAIDILPQQQYYSAYMSSHVGVWTLKAWIEHLSGNTNQYEQYMALINSTYNNVMIAVHNNLNQSADGINMTLYDMKQGLTGLVYNGLLINFLLKQDIIDPNSIAELAFHVMDVAMQTGQKLNTNYLQIECYFSAGCYLYGPNYGPTGVIHQFFLAYQQYPTLMDPLLANPSYYNAIKNTLDFYLSVQLSDGNMPTQIGGTCSNYFGNDSDSRVQFCHGAPGFVNVYLWAAIHFADYNSTAAEVYFHTALVTANVTWQRGLLTKGTMFCHGIGANVNMFWELAQGIAYLQDNGNKEFLQQLEADGYELGFLRNENLWRAKQFVLWTLDWSNINKTRIYDSDDGSSMFAGNYAIHMLYVQLLNEWPVDESVCHPGWNLCL